MRLCDFSRTGVSVIERPAPPLHSTKVQEEEEEKDEEGEGLGEGEENNKGAATSVCRNDEPCAAIYVCSAPPTDSAAAPMRRGGHPEPVKSKPEGRRGAVLVAVTSCTNSWSLAKKRATEKM